MTLSASGSEVTDETAQVDVRHESADAAFGGALLETGTLKVTTHGTTGPPGSATATAAASVAAPEALGGAVTATSAASSCTSDEDGTRGSTTLDDATLVLSATETLGLPAEPAPNTTYAATGSGSEAAFTVVLNEQEVDAAGITVNAVHIRLDGPSGAGDIVLGQSRCATTKAHGDRRPTPPPPRQRLPPPRTRRLLATRRPPSRGRHRRRRRRPPSRRPPGRTPPGRPPPRRMVVVVDEVVVVVGLVTVTPHTDCPMINSPTAVRPRRNMCAALTVSGS